MGSWLASWVAAAVSAQVAWGLVCVPGTARCAPLASSVQVMEAPSAIGDPLSRQPSEFDLNIGRCIDTLRSDVPKIMERELDWSVYTRNVELVDPSGVAIRGIDAYRRVHASLRLVKQVALDDCEIHSQLRYDWVRRAIIVRWQSHLLVKGAAEPVCVDAVSTFELDDDGLIARHRIDRVIFNDQHLAAAPDDFIAQLFASVRPAPVLAF
eukprot:CAMPEP_0197427436 /NCGR_PEP_ID=MMETSP1170-20131217/38280_1 /TAXON_ID=54406 /ORGANISM="Sarcinochrysis sp, Strain CCMP770" /LENGTH=209 /DNA_ID=CAMNT_0042955127 /DNA_START=1 /DNA_END=630 /DNA_ORIENTATION=+